MHRITRNWARNICTSLTTKYAAQNFGRVADYPSRWETPNFITYIADLLGIPGLTIETPYGAAGKTLFTIEEYREIGARIANAITRAPKSR